MKNNTERLYDIIKRPIITEKSMEATTLQQYTFEVVKDATKVEIAQAVELAFPGRKVKSVNTVYMPSKAKELAIAQVERNQVKKQSSLSKVNRLKN